MDSSSAAHVQLQVVGRDGSTIAERPVNLEDLISRHSQSVEMGNGVRVIMGGGAMPVDEENPYGDDDWGVLEDLRKAKALHKASEPVGTGKVDPTEWAAVAPPSDPKIDYSKIEFLDITPSARKFHPIPLAFHSLTSYTDGVSANRLLVYGGRNGRGEEQNEVYEFTLATSSWRRIETHQQQSNGVFSHSCAMDGIRMYILGGFGTGGTPIPKASLQGHHEQRRYDLIVTQHRKAPSPPHTFGILPLLQQLNLSRFTWKNVPLGHQLHVAAHTTVIHKGVLYTFGGVDERMQVSNNLIAITPSTGEVRLLRREGPSPKGRCLHSAVIYHDWMVVFGGIDANNEVLGDVWAFNFATEGWEELPTVGGVDRFGHGCCLLGGRMLVMGGYSGWIDDEGAEPSKAFVELSLSPIKEQFLWRGISARAPLTKGVAFGPIAPSGSGTSFISFGGLTLKGSGSHHGDDYDDTHSNHSASSSVQNTPRGKRSSKRHGGGGGEPALTPCGDVLVVRFRDKPKPVRSSSSARKETLSGDPNELPASTKAFLRRQDDFIAKKNFQSEQVERQRTLSIKEHADANLYLKPAEVDEILEGVDRVIDHLGSYDMPAMPDTVPDKAKRVVHVDESKGLLRQARDVLKSMIPKVTTGHVKSKTHRKMEGAPEEHGGAKPFRRVIVMNLVGQVKVHLSSLNKLTFGNYKWEKKEEYLTFARGCESELNTFIGTMNRIRDAYIQHRLKSIQEDSQRHDTIMSRLKAKIEASRANKAPIKSTYKGKSTREFEVPLEKGSIRMWREALMKAISAMEGLTAQCEKSITFTPTLSEGQHPSYLYSHVASASGRVGETSRALRDAFAAHELSELPPKNEGKGAEVENHSVSYQRFGAFEAKVTPMLASIDTHVKVLRALVLATMGEPTKHDKEAGAHRDAFNLGCARGVAACRAALQTLSASFLSYVPPKAKHQDPHTHAPKINTARASSSVASRPNGASAVPQRQIVALPPNHGRGSPAEVIPCEMHTPPPAPEVPPVAALAAPLHTSFDANTSRLQMPSWNGPFSSHPVAEASNRSSWQAPPNQFDFYHSIRPSAPSSVNQSLLAPVVSAFPAAPSAAVAPPVTVVDAAPSLVVPISTPTPLPATAVVAPLPPASLSSSAVEPVPSLVANPPSAVTALGAAPGGSSVPLTEVSSAYSHLYAIAQPYHTLNTSGAGISRPHTPAQCPGTPFNPDASRDRNMFRGKLTPGERSILMNRQLNTMW